MSDGANMEVSKIFFIISKVSLININIIMIVNYNIN